MKKQPGGTMRRSSIFIARLVMWGSAPIAFLSGLILSAGINMMTSMALFSRRTWPTNGFPLLLGSIFYVVAAATLALSANRVQPLKSTADERLKERRRVLRKEEQERSDEQYVWEEVLDAEGKAAEHERALLIPLILGLAILLTGTVAYVTTLPIFSGQ